MRKLIVLAVVGLAAQLVDGALGMGYGVTSSSLLILVGLTPVAASAAVHFSELGTNIASGISHWKLQNVDWRVVARIAGPGCGRRVPGGHSPVAACRPRRPGRSCRASWPCSGSTSWSASSSASGRGCPARQLEPEVPGAAGRVRRFRRRHRRRWLGSGGHPGAARRRPAAAPQGHRDRRHLRVRRQRRRQHWVPGRARCRGDQLGLRPGPADRRRRSPPRWRRTWSRSPRRTCWAWPWAG